MVLTSPPLKALLFIAPFNQLFFDDNSCLNSSYYGSFRDSQLMKSIFLTDESCLNNFIPQGLTTSGSITAPPATDHQLVWLEEQAVDPSLKYQTSHFRDEFDSFLDTLASHQFLNPEITQQPISDTHNGGYEVLHRTPTAALLSVVKEKAKHIDLIVPRFWKSTLLSSEPVTYHAVPADATKRVSDVLSKLRFDPIVASVVNDISPFRLRNDIRYLTGEDGRSGIISRHSFSLGANTAAAWLKGRFESTGARCELRPFLEGFAPNVVCRYESIEPTDALVLLSAHYDSRGTFGSTRAPGGDDDGSGTISLLGIAQTIKRKGVKFRSNVELVAFAGEEQGLLGSKAYAKELRELGTNIVLMIQADMLAYRAPGEPAQLGLPNLIGTPVVSDLVSNVSELYSPELHVGITPACCSDHQSFFQQGYPSTQVFERAGPIVDPMYHNSGDLSEREGYDLDQVKSIAKVQFATLLHTAGFELSEPED